MCNSGLIIEALYKSAYLLLLIILHVQRARTLVVIIAQNLRAFSNKELVFLHSCFARSVRVFVRHAPVIIIIMIVVIIILNKGAQLATVVSSVVVSVLSFSILGSFILKGSIDRSVLLQSSPSYKCNNKIQRGGFKQFVCSRLSSS